MCSRAALVPAALLAIGVAVGGVGFAAPARADDQSFLNDLNQNHIGTGPVTHPVGMGHFLCTLIRGGMSPTQAARVTWGPGLDMPGIVDTAQHDLCPDTLR